MKKYVYMVITLIILLFGVTLTLRNRQPVGFSYYFGVHWEGALAWLLFVTFGVGAVAGVLASLRLLLRMQRRLVRARKELRRAEQEVSNLRALPIKDVI